MKHKLKVNIWKINVTEMSGAVFDVCQMKDLPNCQTVQSIWFIFTDPSVIHMQTLIFLI